MQDELLEESNIIPIGSVEGVSLDNVPSSDLSEITEAGKSLRNMDQAILEKEAELSNLKQDRKTLAEEVIPTLMAQHNLKLIQLDDDTKIQINEFVDARIVDPDKALNNDSIIKNSITITLGRNENQVADELINILKRDYGIDADRKIAIHHATLKSFCRDALEDPELTESLPRDAFGIFEGKRAKITT
jgi:hypothetical protein